jgi:hypothetical protein
MGYSQSQSIDRERELTTRVNNNRGHHKPGAPEEIERNDHDE